MKFPFFRKGFLLFILLIFISFSSWASKPTLEGLPKNKLIREVYHQIQIKNFLGAKELAERILRYSYNKSLKEIAYIFYWLADGLYKYHQGKTHEIINSIGGLNLYWGYFKEPLYEDWYYSALGKLYTLISQYKRAVIFFILAYKKNPLPERWLDLIYATEFIYYNEIEPYYDYSLIETLLNKTPEKVLNKYEKALYEFEKGLYYLLIGNYSQAYKYFKISYDLDRTYLTSAQANYFMGLALEGMGKLKDAFFYYKLALNQVKQKDYLKKILFHIFKVSAELKDYKSANSYFMGLWKEGDINTDPYLQLAFIHAWFLNNGTFLPHFYWNRFYDYFARKIMWLAFDKLRGKLAFLYFLYKFSEKGQIDEDLLLLWQNFDNFQLPKNYQWLVELIRKKALKNFAVYSQLEKLYLTNRKLFIKFFGFYGICKIAFYNFWKGDFKKALEYLKILEEQNTSLEKFSCSDEKIFIKGVSSIILHKNPYILEYYYNSLKEPYKTAALFWLGLGYLINNRWDLTTIYWEEFLKKYSLAAEKFEIPLYGNFTVLFTTYYLAEHYYQIGFYQKAYTYYQQAAVLLQDLPDLLGIKDFIVFRLYQLSKLLNKKIELSKITPNKAWIEFIYFWNFTSPGK